MLFQGRSNQRLII